MQLPNDSGDLRRKVACVHVGRSDRFFKGSYFLPVRSLKYSDVRFTLAHCSYGLQDKTLTWFSRSL